MKKPPVFLLILSLTLLCFSCKDDEGGGCTSCSSPQTLPFEVCENGDGNATVNGENTGVSFDTYIASLIEAGANCGI